MTIHIDQFEVMYSSNTFVPRIWLLNSGKFIGQLIFLPDGKPLPADNKVKDQVNLYFHLEDFPNVRDLLETEKNTFLLFNGSGLGFENGILTTHEPVGTGIEMKPAAAAA
jgi:hypothetical protein